MIKRNLTIRANIEQEAAIRNQYRSVWDGRGTVLATAWYVRDPEGRAHLGLSEEQTDTLSYFNEGQRAQRRVMQMPLQVIAAQGAAEIFVPKDDAKLKTMTPEQKKTYIDAFAKPLNMVMEEVRKEVEQTLTPEQLTKACSLELLLLPEMGLPSPTMFESLGLTDEQKEQMNAIRAEMEPEFEKLVDETVEIELEITRNMYETLAKRHEEKPFGSVKEWIDQFETTTEEVKKDGRIREKLIKNIESGRNFATRLKTNLMNVLTDEQLDRMQKMFDETPDFVKKLLAEKRAEREKLEQAGVWKPGPDSWRPGDGTPEEFKLERQKARFPRRKQDGSIGR